MVAVVHCAVVRRRLASVCPTVAVVGSWCVTVCECQSKGWAEEEVEVASVGPYSSLLRMGDSTRTVVVVVA